MNSQMPQSPCRLLSYSIAYEKDTDDRCHPEYPEFDNIVSFTVSFVTLGIGGFLMSEEIIEGLRKGASDYYASANFQDMEVISAVGFSEEEIRDVLRHEEITEAEGVTLCGGTISAKDEMFSAEL